MSNPLQVIDISSKSATTSTQLLDAASNQGFLFIDGHDFTQDEVDRLFEVSKAFFDQEHKVKKTYNIIDNIGYTDFTAQNLDPRKTKDYKESYNFGNINFGSGEFNINKDTYLQGVSVKEKLDYPLPLVFQQQKAFIAECQQKLHKLALSILENLTLALDINDKHWFTNRHCGDKASGSVFRFLHYPLMNGNDDNGSVRAGAHTDFGALTLLFQRKNQEGLEIFKQSTQEWLKVPYVESKYVEEGKAAPIVVNIGDLLQYWTNGLLKSTIHRVKFDESKKEDRYSTVFFVQPENDTKLDAVPSSKIPAYDNEYKSTMNALEYLQMRLDQTYNQ